MKSYQLILFSFDGDAVTEKPTFDTIGEAWEYYCELGSKWYFYPFPFITTATGLTIVSTPEGMEKLEGMRVSTIKKRLKALSILDETAHMDADTYAYMLC
jgi:hypothetical protein